MPIRAPTELNLTEVRWLWLQRQTAINNSIFKDKQEKGRATVSSKRNDIYNKNHNRAFKNISKECAPLSSHLLTESQNWLNHFYVDTNGKIYFIEQIDFL